MRPPTSHEIVVTMLSTYHLVHGPGDTGQGSGDITDDRLLLMNPLWSEGSFPELTRCLVEMRGRERRMYWHVAERYLRRRRKQVRDHCPFCRRPAESVHTHHVNGRTERFKPTDIIVDVWHPRVELALVDQGVDWIVTEHRGPPFLPRELYELAYDQFAA